METEPEEEELEYDFDEPDDEEDDDDFEPVEETVKITVTTQMSQEQTELLKNIEELEKKIALLESQKPAEQKEAMEEAVEEEPQEAQSEETGTQELEQTELDSQNIEEEPVDSDLEPKAVSFENLTPQTPPLLLEPALVWPPVKVKKMELMILPKDILLYGKESLEKRTSPLQDLQQNPYFMSKKLVSKKKNVLLSVLSLSLVCALLVSIFVIVKIYM